jgi:hypothetical protein
MVILGTRKSEDVLHEMSFVIIDTRGPKLAIKRMGVSVIVCHQKEKPLGKVVPGWADGVLTLLTKDQKGEI